MKGRGSITENEFLIPKVGTRPSLKRQLAKLKKIRKKRDGENCKICEKTVLNENGKHQLGIVQIGSEDGQAIWSFHEKCYEKYKNHFCRGEEIWMPICRECQEEEEKIIEELNDQSSLEEVQER